MSYASRDCFHQGRRSPSGQGGLWIIDIKLSPKVDSTAASAAVKWSMSYRNFNQNRGRGRDATHVVISQGEFVVGFGIVGQDFQRIVSSSLRILSRFFFIPL